MSKKHYIFPIGDIHIGSKYCNMDFLNKWFNEFEKVGDNKSIYLMGDIIEAPTTRIDAYSINISTNEAIERVVELFEPYQEYIRFSVKGNHCNRMQKEYNYDVAMEIAHRLGVRYSKNDFFDKINVGDNTLTIYGLHGNKASKYPELAMKNFRIDMADVDANLYLHAHNHFCEFQSRYYRNSEDGIRKYYAFTGSFLNFYGSYAHDRGLAPSLPAFMRLTVDKNCHIDCKKYYIDEMM